MPLPIESISDFLTRYKRFTKERSEMRYDEFILRFNHMKTAIESIQSISRELNRRVAKSFNVFELLKVEKKEDNTHTALIANLLDPEGSHAQGHMFLDLFLKHCQRKYNDFIEIPAVIEDFDWLVETRKYTNYGRPDLVVSSFDFKFLLVIENKIGAEESKDQLSRYCEWMNSRRHLSRRTLLFLNKTGYSSKTAGDYPYHILSYKDIYDWLESSLAKIESPKVKDIIVQYMEIIKRFYS